MEHVVQDPLVEVRLSDIVDTAPFLTDNENDFLEAVGKKQFDLVESYISNRRVDINCMDSTGETALQIAVANESPEMIRLLLEHEADIGAALLQAVSKESIECIEVLLEFDNSGRLTSSRSLVREDSTIDNNRYLTPLILAAHNNSYDIVKLLLTKGHTINKVHDRECLCSECEAEGRLGRSLRCLYTYRALASPVYLSLSFLLSNEKLKDEATGDRYKDPEKQTSREDPVRRAFELNKELEELAEKEYEFRHEYLQLSNQCEEFAVALLNQCRNMTEIYQMMSVPNIEKMQYVKVRSPTGEAKILSVLNFAITNKNERFIAHSYSQMTLNSVVYGGFRSWENFGVVMKMLIASLYTVLLPIWAIIHILFPKSKIAKWLSTPILKFIGHTGSFCIFLALLILSSIQDTFSSPLYLNGIDFLLGVWIFGLMLQEVKDFVRQGHERYFSQWWNLVTILMLVMFFISGILWFAGTALVATEEGTWAFSIRHVFGLAAAKSEAYRLILLSNSFFSIGLLLAFLHFSTTFQVNATLGPLQLSLIKMIKDVLKFLLLFFLIYLAFVASLRKVYSQYVWAGRTFLNQTTESSHGFAGVGGSMYLIFWAIFDKTELSSFETDSTFPTKITQNTGEVLFALFNIATILVAVNMLIAMMTNSFQKVADDEDMQWKFSRTRMWMQYIGKGSTLPPPFNIIPSLPSIIEFFRRSKYCMCCNTLQCDYCTEVNMDGFKAMEDRNERAQVLRRLIERHFFVVERSRTPDVDIQQPKTPIHVGPLYADIARCLGRIVSKLEKSSRDENFPAERKAEIHEIVGLWRDAESKYHFEINSRLKERNTVF